MDKRLIFRYRSRTIKSVVTGWGRLSVALELLRLSLQSPFGSPDVVEEWEARRATDGDSVEPRLQEKPRNGKPRAPVPQTDTGGRVREHQGGRVIPR